MQNIFTHKINRIVALTILLCLVMSIFIVLTYDISTVYAQGGAGGADIAAVQTNKTSGGQGVLSGIAGLIIGGALSLVTGIFFKIASWLVQAGGVLLDFSIQYSLRTENFSIEGIKIGWKVFRDIANLTFIFLLLYIAFAMILQLGTNYKRMLINLLVVALLVNFSFFFTGLVIDAGNILGGFLYNAMTDNSTVSLGKIFRDGLQLDTILNEKAAKALTGINKAIFQMLGSVVLLITAFTFLATAILFMIRTIVLTFILVISPLAFVAAISDKTRQYFNQWLQHLIHHSFVAPIYLLLIFVVVKIMQGGAILTESKKLQVPGGNFVQDGTFAQAINIIGVEGYAFDKVAGVVLFYALITGLIIAAYVIAQRLTGSVAQLSVKLAGKATGLAAAGGAVAYRRTIGRGLRAARDSEALGKLTASDNRFTRSLGRVTRGAADYGARASGDVRGGFVGATVGATAGAALGAGGIRASTGRPGGRGGYEEIRAGQVRRKTRKTEESIQAARGASAVASHKAGEQAAQQSAQRGEAREQQEEAREAVIKERQRNVKEQQIKDLEGRGFVGRALSTARGATAVNREAAELLRAGRDAPEAIGQEAQNPEELRRMIREEIERGK